MILRFEKEHFSLRAESRFVCRMDGQVHVLETGSENSRIHSLAAVSGKGSERRIDVTITNLSERPVEILSIESLRIESWADLDCGLPWQDIQVMIQGRHKNDIPSVVTLGCRDEAMEDALDGMTESGIRNQGGTGEACLNSDTLTLFRGKDGYLSVEFPEGCRYFCQTAVTPGPAGPAIRTGCEPGIVLEPGSTLQAEPVVLRTGPDWSGLMRIFTTEKIACLRTRAGVLPVPTVFCTWYYYGLTVSYADVKENLDCIVRQELPYTVFQIDEGWEATLGEWRPNARFPVSMKALAEEIRAAGMIPGIWTSPFIAHESASVWRLHSDWTLRDEAGNPVLFPMNDTVYQVLDITLKPVRDYVRDLYKTLTDEWGYRYHKLDFTRAPVIYPWARRGNPALAWPEAYRLALRAVREGIGDDSYLLICGGLYDAAVGIADAQRTGSDVLSMWTSAGGGGKAVPCTVKQNLLRTYMGAWWANDADCLMLRRQTEMTRGLNLTLGLLSGEEIKVMLVNQYMSGGLFSQTEPLAHIDRDRLREIRHLLPLLPLEAEPDLFDGARIPGRIRVKGEGFEELVLINWDDTKPLPVRVSAAEVLHMDRPDGMYLLSAFYSGRWAVADGCETVDMGMLLPHSAEIVRVQRYESGKSYIVGSNGHYALGGELAEIRESGDRLSLIPRKPLPFGADYCVLRPNGQCQNVRIEGTGKD